MFQPQKDVRNFMIMAGQTLPTQPTISDQETRALRVKLILEELLELADAGSVSILIRLPDKSIIDLSEAFNNDAISYEPSLNGNGPDPDLTLMADALADIQYVNEGAANAFGLDLEGFFREVHRSNMTKKWTLLDVNEHINVHEGLPTYKGNKITIEVDRNAAETDARRYIVRDEMGKLVKSPSYKKADLEAVLQEQICCGGTCDNSCKA